jgi:hypothetical protein
MMRAGDSFGTAVKREKGEIKAENAKVAATPQPTLQNLEAQARANVAATARNTRAALDKLAGCVYPLETTMYDAHFAREVPAARAIEAASGAGSILSGIIRPIEAKLILPKSWGGETLHENAEKQGEAIVGGAKAIAGAGKEWERADAAKGAYRAALSECRSAVTAYEHAYGDPQEFPAAAERLSKATAALGTAAKAFVQAAEPISHYNETVKVVYEEAKAFVMVNAIGIVAAPVAGALAHPLKHAVGHIATSTVERATVAGAAVLGIEAVSEGAEAAVVRGVVGAATRAAPQVAKDVAQATIAIAEESGTSIASAKVHNAAIDTVKGGMRDADDVRPIE